MGEKIPMRMPLTSFAFGTHNSISSSSSSSSSLFSLRGLSVVNAVLDNYAVSTNANYAISAHLLLLQYKAKVDFTACAHDTPHSCNSKGRDGIGDIAGYHRYPFPF